MNWNELGAVPPAELLDARLQLHQAAQIVASAGVTLLPEAPDDSHPNLGWAEPLGALLGRALPTTEVQLGLRLADLTLLLVSPNQSIKTEFRLHERTLEDGYEWLTAATTSAGEELPREGIRRASYSIPSHAVGSGSAFSGSPGAAFVELGRWFSNAQLAVTDAVAGRPNASDVRCWPHHFDLASLVVTRTKPDGSLEQSVGIGFSPGDDGYAEPYWYVSPWPYPDPTALAELEVGGHWHTQGHTSAILLGSDLLKRGAGNQADRLRAFLSAAVDASQTALQSVHP